MHACPRLLAAAFASADGAPAGRPVATGARHRRHQRPHSAAPPAGQPAAVLAPRRLAGGGAQPRLCGAACCGGFGRKAGRPAPLAHACRQAAGLPCTVNAQASSAGRAAVQTAGPWPRAWRRLGIMGCPTGACRACWQRAWLSRRTNAAAMLSSFVPPDSACAPGLLPLQASTRALCDEPSMQGATCGRGWRSSARQHTLAGRWRVLTRAWQTLRRWPLPSPEQVFFLRKKKFHKIDPKPSYLIMSGGAPG